MTARRGILSVDGSNRADREHERKYSPVQTLVRSWRYRPRAAAQLSAGRASGRSSTVSHSTITASSFTGGRRSTSTRLARKLSAPAGRRIRAIVLISPNNPTGSIVRDAELDAMATLARQHQLAIIADECSPIIRFPALRRPACCGSTPH